MVGAARVKGPASVAATAAGHRFLLLLWGRGSRVMGLSVAAACKCSAVRNKPDANCLSSKSPKIALRDLPDQDLKYLGLRSKSARNLH